jgi:hypothetical protein
MSDGCDMIVAQTRDRRFQATEIDERYLVIDNPVDAQIDDYVELVRPISDRIISMMDGNHHLEMLKRTGTHPTRRIGYALWGKTAEERVHSWAGFLITKFKYGGKDSRVRTLKWYLSHGAAAGGRTLGGPKTALANVAKGRVADIYVFNHSHGLWADDNLKLDVNSNLKVTSRKEIIINGGCYKKSRTDDWNTSWEESKEFAPNALGHIEVYVELGRNAINTYTVKRMIL